jgi:heme/copper-type cytochrome/quinol oxidase subunit 3
MSTRQLGMLVFLASLSVLFGAALVAMVITRLGGAAWPQRGFAETPPSLWVSTLLMVGPSWCLHRSVAAARRNRSSGIVRALDWALLLAVAFVLSQLLSWMQLLSDSRGSGTPTLYPFVFYFLTGLHAVHVLGGCAGAGFGS